MNEEKYTIAEEYDLPSKGLLYDKPINPHVKLKSMSVRDELKRKSPTNTPYKTLSEIIETCLLTKLGMPVYDLCVSDYEYLLHKLRVVTYGPEYKIIIGCPHCNETYETSINLDELNVNEYTDDVQSLLTLTLPVSNKIVELNYQTPRMLDNIELKLKEFKKRNKTQISTDFTPLIRLKEFINLVDGNKLNDTELENFILNLSAKDGLAIEQRISKINNSFGIDPTISVTCDKCGGEVLTFFRFGPEFFGPTTD